MKADVFAQRLREIVHEDLPFPAAGQTGERHRRLMEIGREDLSLAKLAEAHWDAVAILAEAGRSPVPDALYAVWASEVPGHSLALTRIEKDFVVSGSKPFCSGLGIVDRALITAGSPVSNLIDLDLRRDAARILYDASVWKVGAFAQTQTGSLTFDAAEVSASDVIGKPGWYTARVGFWHGACGPAACWAGGVQGLLDYGLASKRKDPHTMAHLGAMQANVWALSSLLESAGLEIDAAPNDHQAAVQCALKLRHVVENLGTDCLRRFARAYGPQPLSMNEEIARRYQEVDLYVRQSHAERDLELLGRMLTPSLD